jgi:CubicO group peptidase (beta-lactamase class C family)
MRTIRFPAIAATVAAASLAAGAPMTPESRPAPVYWPEKGRWEHRKPSEVGMDDAALAEAAAWAQKQVTDIPKDFSTQAATFGRPLGPVPSTRADTNGVILRRGYIVAEFGDTGAVDPTYSVAKSYLSTLLGLTIDRGLVRSVRDRVADYIHDGGYDSPHNSKVTWQHHATQTSEWEGELFGKSHTFIGREEFGAGEMKPRALLPPGSHYEYNDVRVNRLALSLLRLWKRPLPDVLKTEIMDPIGASDTWVYHGYDNSTVEIDGRPMKSVTGGTRWGGGLWISTLDHARFGHLILHRGLWNGRRVLSESWLREATRPQGVQPGYGYLWWLNTEGAWPAAPRSSFSAQGAGSNSMWIDPEHDLVIVWRWHRGDAQAELYRRVLAAIRPGA